MDELSVIEARRDANLANLRRAFAAPAERELPVTFASLLSKLSQGRGVGARPEPPRKEA